MERRTRRLLVAWGLAAVAATVAFAFNRDLSALLLVLVGAAAAVLVAAPPAAPALSDAATKARRDGDADALIDAVAEPLLVVRGARVERANAAARQLLGPHILGEDVRLAIRHPAAADRLAARDVAGDAVHMVGLGARDQHWEMRVHPAGEGLRVVHLADRTDAHAADRIRVDFVANASHELRTPLASLLGFVETLADDAGDEPETRRRFLAVMHDEARRMQRLIDDLISLSRIEAEKYRAPDQSVDLAALAARVRAELAREHDGRGQDVIVDAEPAPPVLGDPAQLSQLLHNVIGNAMKYGRAGTPVTVGIAPDGDGFVQLTVADEGDGIAPEHLPRLTERFYRVDPGRSRAVGGTGLGLAIVKHIVERHRGRLDIASDAGRGTRVTMRLPAALSQ